jgi:hypothetical protein
MIPSLITANVDHHQELIMTHLKLAEARVLLVMIKKINLINLFQLIILIVMMKYKQIEEKK